MPQARAQEAWARARDPGPNGVFLQTQFENGPFFKFGKGGHFCFIEDACGVSSPHPQTLGAHDLRVLCATTTEIVFFGDFVVIWGVRGPPGGSLEEGTETALKKLPRG